MSSAWARLLGLALLSAGVTSLAGCHCNDVSFDQIFLLDARGDEPLGFDASLIGASADAGDAGSAGAPDAGSVTSTAPADASDDGSMPVPDADGTPAVPGPSLDCTPAAADCTPGGDCLAACNCVLTRDQLDAHGPISIQRCQLLPTSGPPAVEVAYKVLDTACGD